LAGILERDMNVGSVPAGADLQPTLLRSGCLSAGFVNHRFPPS
jgi:hypothetical protein